MTTYNIPIRRRPYWQRVLRLPLVWLTLYNLHRKGGAAFRESWTTATLMALLTVKRR